MSQITTGRKRNAAVLTALLVSFIVGGCGSVVLGLLLSAWIKDFGWSNVRASSIATAFVVTSLLGAPVAGLLTDRYGPRAIMMFGIALTAGALVAASQCSRPAGMFLDFVFAGAGYAAAYYVPVSVVVTGWIPERRNLAMGLVMGVTAMGAASLSMWTAHSIQCSGWRRTLEELSAMMFVLLPIALLTFNPPKVSPIVTCSEAPARPMSRAGARTFLKAAATGALFNAGLGALYYHIVDLLVRAGYSTEGAGAVLGISWILSAVGSFGLGMLADRVPTRTVLSIAIVSCACGSLFLVPATHSSGAVWAVLFLLFWGLTANSASQFLPVVLAEQFGSAQLGRLVGFQSAAGGLAGAAAPLVTGILHDHYRSYAVAICLSAVTTLAAAICAARLPSGAR